MQLSAADWTIAIHYMSILAEVFMFQKLQNSVAKLIPSRQHKGELHWLNVETRITFKVLLIVHKIVIGHCPESLSF